MRRFLCITLLSTFGCATTRPGPAATQAEHPDKEHQLQEALSKLNAALADYPDVQHRMTALLAPPTILPSDCPVVVRPSDPQGVVLVDYRLFENGGGVQDDMVQLVVTNRLSSNLVVQAVGSAYTATITPGGTLTLSLGNYNLADVSLTAGGTPMPLKTLGPTNVAVTGDALAVYKVPLSSDATHPHRLNVQYQRRSVAFDLTH